MLELRRLATLGRPVPGGCEGASAGETAPVMGDVGVCAVDDFNTLVGVSIVFCFTINEKDWERWTDLARESLPLEQTCRTGIGILDGLVRGQGNHRPQHLHPP